jgi:protein TonB
MHLASFLTSSDPDHVDRRRRIASMALTIAIHVGLLLLLLELAPPLKRLIRSGGSQLITVSTAPDAQEETASSSATRTHRTHAASPPAAAVVPPPKIVLPDKAAPWVLTPGLERFDVRQVPQTQRATANSDASATDEANADSGDHPAAYGPGGQPLYDADWYREPTDAELAFYLKKARPGPGFAVIGCQMVARYHVANCFPIDESLGSGLARAMVEASWQFQVLPPRIGNKQQLGTWVRIRFDFREQKDR